MVVCILTGDVVDVGGAPGSGVVSGIVVDESWRVVVGVLEGDVVDVVGATGSGVVSGIVVGEF